jgi:hypothetical protein
MNETVKTAVKIDFKVLRDGIYVCRKAIVNLKTQGSL